LVELGECKRGLKLERARALALRDAERFAIGGSAAAGSRSARTSPRNWRSSTASGSAASG
jgi:hypothetical protein